MNTFTDMPLSRTRFRRDGECIYSWVPSGLLTRRSWCSGLYRRVRINFLSVTFTEKCGSITILACYSLKSELISSIVCASLSDHKFFLQNGMRLPLHLNQPKAFVRCGLTRFAQNHASAHETQNASPLVWKVWHPS